MADNGIIFSAPMVLALLDGRKTQTRRVLKPQPPIYDFCGPEWYHPTKVDRHGMEYPGAKVFGIYGDEWGQRLPYAVGDRLWVKEAVRFDHEWHECPPRTFGPEDAIRYEADGHLELRLWGNPFKPGKLRSPFFMPRWASRITLTVTDVRVQRVQEISEADALAEGVRAVGLCDALDICGGAYSGLCACLCISPHELYRELWTSIHGPAAWASNPWVAAYTFTVCMGNIDADPR